MNKFGRKNMCRQIMAVAHATNTKGIAICLRCYNYCQVFT